MKNFKYLLSIVAFVFAIGAAFAFNTSSALTTTVWESPTADGSGSCTSVSINLDPSCGSIGQTHCRKNGASGNFLFQDDDCDLKYVKQ